MASGGAEEKKYHSKSFNDHDTIFESRGLPGQLNSSTFERQSSATASQNDSTGAQVSKVGQCVDPDAHSTK